MSGWAQRDAERKEDEAMELERLRAEVERLKSDLSRSEAETAACLDYMRCEMHWENFRAEMHSCGTDPVKMTAAERNAAKLLEFLNDGNRGEKVLAEIKRLTKENARLVAVGHKHGWNGVENSKILAAFFDDEIERLTQERDEALRHAQEIEGCVANAHFLAFGPPRNYEYVDWRTTADLLVADISTTQAERDQLREQLAAAQKDSERIDWLEADMPTSLIAWTDAASGCRLVQAGDSRGIGQDVRSAIDTARTK